MIKKCTTLAILGLFAFSFTNAQTIKNCDISVQITSPANNVTIAYGDSATISFSYTNHGPDVLPAGDTLFFATGDLVMYSALLIDLQVNSTILMNNSVTFWNPTNDTLSGNICILHIPQESVIYNGTDTATKTYNDSDTTNDLSCIHVFFKGPPETAIQNVGSENPLLSLYPNPAKNTIHFNLDKQLQSLYNNAIITDVQGRIVKQANIAQNIDNNYTIDVSNLNNGIYFIELQSSKGSNSIKGKVVISK